MAKGESPCSPLMRGCFLVSTRLQCPHLVFPAYARLFPYGWILRASLTRVPRLCGVVSSSPSIAVRMIAVFPAYAGLFPAAFDYPPILLRVPRLCGVVSYFVTMGEPDRECSPLMRGCFP